MFQKFVELYGEGDLVNAEKKLLLVLDSKIPLNEDILIAVYNNLGATYTLLGRYKEALDYYSMAETLAKNDQNDLLTLGDIYINKAIIYGNQKSYTSSIEYFEKGIRIYLDAINPDKRIFYRISTAYLNIGIIYYETRDYQTALKYLKRSYEIKQTYYLSESVFVLLNIAKTYVKLKSYREADKYFQRSIESCNKEFGTNYFRLAEAFFGYGQFLQTIGRNAESQKAFKNALYICLKNYGEKHTFSSLAYKHLGDNYLNRNNYDSALFYYQKSLIAVVKDFNNPDIFSNPSVDSSLFDIRLLDNLKSKAKALELLAQQQNGSVAKLRTMNASLETIELALKLIDIIRSNYMSEESRIYLAENEKETYVFATHIAAGVYSLTNVDSLVYKIYRIAQRAKAAVLRNEITGNELLYSSAIPDSLRESQTDLSSNIAAYNKLILEESRKTKPDSVRIALWKDALFDMNREKEQVAQQISIVFPQYYDLIRKTDPVSPQNIQRQLKKDETIVDYLLSNNYSNGKRKLYIFLLTRDKLVFHESDLDSMFIKYAQLLRNTFNPALSGTGKKEKFINYATALNYMYLNLISPVEGLFRGKRLIIIPDEEIGWLPFDAFLKSKPLADKSDFEGLHFLINDYTFSYGYSSSLIFGSGKSLTGGAEVISFSPSYGGKTSSFTSPVSLGGSMSEIESVSKLFKGKKFEGDKATKANFTEVMRDPAIFHLAMHSMSDSLNSRYSYMLFESHDKQQEGSRLYNYEISLKRLRSPMVVLSACNSGTGTLYSGEGLMSLARGFMLAGASSVIKTAWEVNDEASSEIITRFYYHLSKGKQKNDALRLAKLEYLKKSSPAFTNPYYWAAYEVLGDNTPVVRNNTLLLITGIVIIVILTCGGLVFYFKRRSIFSEPSR